MKAKDLRGKNVEDIENQTSEPEEEDQVAAAYENISKRLESIRSGQNSDDEDEPRGKKQESEEPELEEWKGPKPPSKTSVDDDVDEEEEEQELRKVNLRNLEDDADEPRGKKQDEDDEEDGIEDLESEEESEGKHETRNTKHDARDEKEDKWEPAENDPLDDDSESEEEADEEGEPGSMKQEARREDLSVEVVDEAAGEEEEPRFERKAAFSEVEPGFDRPRTAEPQPDTLDDLATEGDNFSGRRPGPGLGEEEDYSIPSLRGSGQNAGNMGYNTPPQRGSFGEGYAPKRDRDYMDGNDPNNYFSQHSQPQAPKRANKFHLLILVVIGIVVIGFTVYVLKGGFGGLSMTSSEPSPSPAPVESPTPTPTPSPEPTVNRGDFTVRVLNGTSTSGLAKTVNDKLKELGYDTATPGNATNSAFTQTIVRVKEGTDAANLLQALIKDLSPDYSAAEGPNLAKNSSNDAEVILGTK